MIKKNPVHIIIIIIIMSVSILIIERAGTIKSLKWKSYDESLIYKKAGFRSNEGFAKQTTWSVTVDKKKYNIALYAKKNGKATQENKYDYPPPVDKELYFGNNILINYDEDGAPVHLTEPDWKKVYEHLFGGFEDIGQSEDDSEDEAKDIYNDLDKTANGYAKDGFIVSDKEDDDYIDCGSELSEEEYI